MAKLTQAQKRTTEAWIKRKGNPHRKADEMAYANGCWYDKSAADDVVSFFGQFLKHSKGQWAGEPFTLLRWQEQDVIRPLFGWTRPDGTRRYRTAYIEIPKKNGKSTLCAGIALYMLLGDGEPGAEIYSAAATRDQAAIVYREASSMVKASKSLDDRLKRVDSLKHMSDARYNSWYKALSADAGTNEGLNIHGLIMDEMHAQPSDTFWNTLMYGGAARRQPLMVIITTAGFDQDSLCYDFHKKGMQIQAGELQDDACFAYVRTGEWAMKRKPEGERDEVWKDEKVWFEANPSLGDTISLESFREDFNRAVQSPRLVNSFKRYRLNIWTAQEEQFFDMDHWAACGETYEEEFLMGKRCYMGMDLASTSDFCAVVLFFPDEKRLLPYFWIPEEAVKERERRGDGFYRMWAQHRHLRTTEGDVADYNVIQADILEMMRWFKIQRCDYDATFASQLSNNLLAEGLNVVPRAQTFKYLSPGLKTLEKWVIAHEIQHPRHPVLTWCAGNTAIREHREGAIMPGKRESKRKIDGITASVLAIGGWLDQPDLGAWSESPPFTFF